MSSTGSKGITFNNNMPGELPPELRIKSEDDNSHKQKDATKDESELDGRLTPLPSRETLLKESDKR